MVRSADGTALLVHARRLRRRAGRHAATTIPARRLPCASRRSGGRGAARRAACPECRQHADLSADYRARDAAGWPPLRRDPAAQHLCTARASSRATAGSPTWAAATAPPGRCPGRPRAGTAPGRRRRPGDRAAAASSPRPRVAPNLPEAAACRPAGTSTASGSDSTRPTRPGPPIRHAPHDGLLSTRSVHLTWQRPLPVGPTINLPVSRRTRAIRSAPGALRESRRERDRTSAHRRPWSSRGPGAGSAAAAWAARAGLDVLLADAAMSPAGQDLRRRADAARDRRDPEARPRGLAACPHGQPRPARARLRPDAPAPLARGSLPTGPRPWCPCLALPGAKNQRQARAERDQRGKRALTR